jgi:putative spermidine/putrescine transport system substrate-binding protein/spermidine/putrescine transport system substrate-binding protein
MKIYGDGAQDFSRRQLFGGAAIGAAALVTASMWETGVADAAKTGKLANSLNVLCWEGYTDPHFTKSFTKQTGVTINSTFIGSNDELVAKLRGNPGLYDLVTPSCDTTGLLIQAKQVQAINLANVPNAKTTFPFFLTAPNVYVGGKHYGVPMAWGFIPLVYNTKLIKVAPDSWADLWNPKYKGKISMWQDISMLWTTSLLLGYKDTYTMTDKQLEAVKAKLIAQKPMLRKYWSTAAELSQLFESGEVIIGESFGGLTVNQLRQSGYPAAEIIPKEGATSWFDNWMITKTSNKVSTCEAWLNHIQSPATQVDIAKYTGYGITNTNAVHSVPSIYRDSYHLADPTFISKLNFWKRVPRRQSYLDIMNAVLAA